MPNFRQNSASTKVPFYYRPVKTICRHTWPKVRFGLWIKVPFLRGFQSYWICNDLKVIFAKIWIVKSRLKGSIICYFILWKTPLYWKLWCSRKISKVTVSLWNSKFFYWQPSLICYAIMPTPYVPSFESESPFTPFWPILYH